MPYDRKNERDQDQSVANPGQGPGRSGPAGHESGFGLGDIELPFPGSDGETVVSTENGEEKKREAKRNRQPRKVGDHAKRGPRGKKNSNRFFFHRQKRPFPA